MYTICGRACMHDMDFPVTIRMQVHMIRALTGNPGNHFFELQAQMYCSANLSYRKGHLHHCVSFYSLLRLHSLLLQRLRLYLEEAFQDRLCLSLPWGRYLFRDPQGAPQCVLKLDVIVLKVSNKARDKPMSSHFSVDFNILFYNCRVGLGSFVG